MKKTKLFSILMAEDDPDDRLLAKDAFEKNNVMHDLYFVMDGEDLMDYLLQRGQYNAENAPRPGLILLDLNMPKKDGREALVEIKSSAKLKRIPVVVLSTSRSESDINTLYNLGANSFITKPATFDSLVDVTGRLWQYWFDTVKLPI